MNNPPKKIRVYLEKLIDQQAKHFDGSRDLKLLKELELAANMGFDMQKYRHLYNGVREAYLTFEKLKNDKNIGDTGYQA